jgi:hypothetical protein
MVSRLRTSLGLAALALASCGSSQVPADAATDGGAERAPDGPGDGASERAPDGATSPRDGGVDAYAADGPCMPGLPRCVGDFGYEMCQQDGTWGAPESCAGYSMNGTTSYCAEIPVATGGTWGTCVDPACWYWLGRDALAGATPVGICLPDGTINRCNAGGTLTLDACAGTCTQVATLDGRALGYCAPACADGARECLGGPFYRTCADGRWSDAAVACDAGACNPVTVGALPSTRCGGACETGTSRCSADLGAVESCAAGAWTVARTCLLGRCVPAGVQAECETACAPGEHQCAFDGAPTERLCDATGLWVPETACAAGATCRMSGDVALGCVACVGARTGGGNAYGAADSRCAADGGVESCGVDATWQASATCANGQVCAAISRGASTLAACASN